MRYYSSQTMPEGPGARSSRHLDESFANSLKRLVLAGPLWAATEVAIQYDTQAQQELGIDQTGMDASNAFSGFGLYGSIAGAAWPYFLGSAKGNDHVAETERVGDEASVKRSGRDKGAEAGDK